MPSNKGFMPRNQTFTGAKEADDALGINRKKQTGSIQNLPPYPIIDYRGKLVLCMTREELAKVPLKVPEAYED